MKTLPLILVVFLLPQFAQAGQTQGSFQVRGYEGISAISHSTRSHLIAHAGRAGLIEALLSRQQASGSSVPVAFSPSLFPAVSQWVSNQRSSFAIAQFTFGGQQVAFGAFAQNTGSDEVRVAQALQSNGWRALDTTALSEKQYIATGALTTMPVTLNAFEINVILTKVGHDQRNANTRSTISSSLQNLLEQYQYGSTPQQIIQNEICSAIGTCY